VPVLVVGLGNPGPEHASTRHNVGWLLLDELVRQSGTTDFKKRFLGDLAKGSLGGRECMFLRPGTFMNESGRSVQPAAAFFRVGPRDIIVLHDELDLPFGDVRVKVGGGHAGHNGLRSIVQHLGTPDFVRVRMGIGRPPAGFAGDVADYVLSSFGPTERACVPEMVVRGATAVLRILTEGVDRAMNEANTRDRGGEPGEKSGK
jgi:PTH1 family peptidyl-tRNA hydrolase